MTTDQVEMFHHVSGQLVLGPHRHLDDLVEVVGRDVESVQHPRERALRVVRVDHNLQAAGEQRLVEHLMTQQALHRPREHETFCV